MSKQFSERLIALSRKAGRNGLGHTHLSSRHLSGMLSLRIGRLDDSLQQVDPNILFFGMYLESLNIQHAHRAVTGFINVNGDLFLECNTIDGVIIQVLLEAILQVDLHLCVVAGSQQSNLCYVRFLKCSRRLRSQLSNIHWPVSSRQFR